jgi:hypothetical protein
MKLASVIKRLTKINEDYIKKHGHEPVVWDVEADNHEGELMLDLVEGKKKVKHGTQSTSPAETYYIKYAR